MPERQLLSTAEVAAIFRVDPTTVANWDRAGRFPAGTVTRTPGGTRRFDAAFIRAVANGTAHV